MFDIKREYIDIATALPGSQMRLGMVYRILLSAKYLSCEEIRNSESQYGLNNTGNDLEMDQGRWHREAHRADLTGAHAVCVVIFPLII